MYAGKAETVDVPERNVHILKNGYVYWTSSGHWDKEKNRTVDDRRSIGKLDPGNPAKMYPNKAYFTFYLVSEKDAEKQQLFRNDSSPDPGTAPSLTVFREPGRFSEVMNFGPFLAITLTARNMGTLFLLKKFFPGLQHEILALALCILSRKNPQNRKGFSLFSEREFPVFRRTMSFLPAGPLSAA